MTSRDRLPFLLYTTVTHTHTLTVTRTHACSRARSYSRLLSSSVLAAYTQRQQPNNSKTCIFMLWAPCIRICLARTARNVYSNDDNEISKIYSAPSISQERNITLYAFSANGRRRTKYLRTIIRRAPILNELNHLIQTKRPTASRTNTMRPSASTTSERHQTKYNGKKEKKVENSNARNRFALSLPLSPLLFWSHSRNTQRLMVSASASVSDACVQFMRVWSWAYARRYTTFYLNVSKSFDEKKSKNFSDLDANDFL